jgi:predicted Rossmann fold nucleotide-binding protein DprA/Smf involved in DNA uptake
MSLESLTAELGAEAAALPVALLGLELSGLIEELPGPCYARVRARIRR